MRAGLETEVEVKGKVTLGWTLVPRGFPPPPSPAFRAVGWGRRYVDSRKVVVDYLACGVGNNNLRRDNPFAWVGGSIPMKVPYAMIPSMLKGRTSHGAAILAQGLDLGLRLASPGWSLTS